MPGRVGSRRHFERLARSSRRGRGTSVRVQYSEQVDSPHEIAVAYAISRRVGGAVVRNRIRRRLRALMDGFADEVTPGSYLITVDFRVVEMSYEQLGDDLRAALSGAGTLR